MRLPFHRVEDVDSNSIHVFLDSHRVVEDVDSNSIHIFLDSIIIMECVS